ncbi:MAG: TonB-dependent receptor [Melioribacter sp.]|uniref:TonB-dependent receptor n=1 Tax=Rosettibacter primus TaxID=3111523 RepID=UPI00247E440B|nr:TonB-dependent receptor [Melioribacter sp.]
MKKVSLLLIFIYLQTIAYAATYLAGTTGKIAGKISDKSTGEPLIGANVIITGTSLGAATDVNGHYTILDIPPGIYSIQISYIGYRKLTINDVRVFIDQTTRIDAALESEAIELGAMIIVAERKLIKPDVATSVVAISEKEVQELPINSVAGVIGLQAGVQGLTVRGGGSDRLLFLLDGVTLRDPRNNLPTASVPLSSIKEISLERGGFNAEYGQVRSGIVNVVTREGSRQNYSGSIQIRYRPPGPKYWRGEGIKDIHDPYSYIFRPFYDPQVCWTGTSAWDEYTRKQYPEFMGWNEVSKKLNSDNDPNNDLTPLGAQRVFMYETRKKQPNNQPDYEIDAGFGGPVPFISKALGDLRFFTSYRSNREMLLFPLTRPDYRDYDWTIQLNSDLTPSLKLRISTLIGKQFTIRHNWDATGIYYYPRYPNEIAGVASNIGAPSDLISMFSDFNFSLADIGHQSVASKLTHSLSSKTFYEILIEHYRSDYNVRPTRWRDTSKLYEIVPGFFEDENPFGYWPYEAKGVLITGGQHVAKARDFSKVSSTTIKGDLTSQINFNNLIKTGFEFVYNDLNLDYGTIASATAGKTYAVRVQQRVNPIRAAFYAQDKLEFEGLTVNLGLRVDYSNSNTDWWLTDPFDVYFYSSKYNESRSFPLEKSKPQWQISPRLGIAHPITENAKLFFNYGHFKQLPQYESIFRIQRNSLKALTSIGDPNVILAKTISYELGFDYLITEDIFLQVAAFYNDIYDQQDYTQYISSSAGFSYSKTTNNNYEDTRGFELTLRKTRGRWWSGFANYTYLVRTSGHFGSSQIYDDPSLQKAWDEQTVNLYQDRPIPQPFARVNLNFFTPDDFGPEIFGHKIFAGWLLNLIVDWQAGGWVTWNPKGLPDISYNVQSVDYFNTTLRLNKSFDVGKLRIDLFMDVYNVLNTLRLWNTGDQDYLRSLHLPKSEAYDNIPGNDKVGDYRKPNVEFQPMEYQAVIDPTKPGKNNVIYYEGTTSKYYEYVNNQWSEVDQNRINKILEDKAYIDMPNQSTFWFLNPRSFYFGLRLTFNL